jgi:hypothetical protein
MISFTIAAAILSNTTLNLFCAKKLFRTTAELPLLCVTEYGPAFTGIRRAET